MEYIDLKAQYRAYQSEIDQKVSDCMAKASFILGSEVQNFEEELATYAGVKHAIGCASGTDALQLIYMAYGIGVGDAVFCPAMTFIASIEPACMLGATPVFCDIDPVSYCLDAASLERQIQHVQAEGKLHPKAVIAVDFLGNPADHDRLKMIARKYDLLLVEDAAQSMGGSYQGVRCGRLADICATSFFPSKPLGCYGDGGAVLTDDDDLDEKLRSLRVHGKGATKYDNVRIGINSRLDALQAAILRVKLSHLEEEIQIRQEIASRYDEALKDVVQIPVIGKSNVSAYAQYVICMKDKESRDQMRNSLQEAGIPSILYYPHAMQDLPVFSEVDHYGESLQNAADYADRNLGIPFGPFLKKEDQDHIIDVIRGFCKDRGNE